MPEESSEHEEILSTNPNFNDVFREIRFAPTVNESVEFSQRSVCPGSLHTLQYA